MIAAPNDSVPQSVKELSGKIIATSYPNILKKISD